MFFNDILQEWVAAHIDSQEHLNKLTPAQQQVALVSNLRKKARSVTASAMLAEELRIESALADGLQTEEPEISKEREDHHRRIVKAEMQQSI